MAKLLVAGDSTVPNALSAYLRETLPDDFIVVSDPAVQGCAADAIAVGPGGLTLIAGEGRPAADQPEPRRHAASTTGSPEDAAVAALRAFLKDTFPTLAAPIRYVTAIPDPDAEPPLWRAVDFIGAGQEELAEAVVRIQAADPIALDDPRDARGGGGRAARTAAQREPARRAAVRVPGRRPAGDARQGVDDP